MSDNKKMTEQEIDDLVKKTMDEVMAAITPGLEAKHTEYMEKRAKDGVILPGWGRVTEGAEDEDEAELDDEG